MRKFSLIEVNSHTGYVATVVFALRSGKTGILT